MIFDKLSGETGRKTAHTAVDEIVDHHLAPSPRNYELWLHYLNDWTPGLRDEMTRELRETGALDETATELLYERYFSNAKFNNEVVQTGERLANELATALKTLNRADKQTRSFGDNLDKTVETLTSGDLQQTQIKELTLKLAEATRQMAQQNRELTAQLQNSSGEIEVLRTHLQDVRNEALTDSLTGIANRKQFDETIKFRVREATKLNYPLSLAVCDIDFFKSFNDTYGHQTGDQVIRFVATTLERLALKDFLVARYGGEEFAIIMPRVSIDMALPILERMRAAIEAKQLMRKSTNESMGNVTVSFGASQMIEGDGPTSLFSRADDLLYQSKHNGRNRITGTAKPTRPLLDARIRFHRSLTSASLSRNQGDMRWPSKRSLTKIRTGSRRSRSTILRQ